MLLCVQFEGLPRRVTELEGLYAGLSAGGTGLPLEARIQQLVESPAAVEDALASLLDHPDPVLQVSRLGLSSENLPGQVVRVAHLESDFFSAGIDCHAVTGDQLEVGPGVCLEHRPVEDWKSWYLPAHCLMLSRSCT